MGQESVSRLHSWRHADYAEAGKDIHTYLGDISEEEIFGRQVLCAVYVRPNRTEKGAWMTKGTQEEDVYQGKALLVLKCGPSAFQGDESYLAATFGPKGAPKPGDWLLARPSDGIQISVMGEGAVRVQVPDFGKNMVDKYDWDGWPCRVLNDENFIGRMSLPHVVV